MFGWQEYLTGTDAGDGDSYFRVLDITIPSAPVDVGPATSPIPTDVWTQDIVVDGDHAYAGTMRDGLYILDISDPADPLVEGVWPDAEVNGVAVSGSLAYLVTSKDEGFQPGMSIIDVSSPTSLMLVSFLPLPESV